MGLINPGALIFLALVPALVLAYLVRERPTRLTVSSVLAFRALRALRAERPWGRPRFDPLFFVELIILGLAVLAMAEPYVARARNPLAVVLDNSAVMQARMPSGQTRMEAARARLAAMLSGEAGGTEVTLYLTAPQPHQAGDPQQGLAAARSAIERVDPTDTPDNLAALARLVSDLTSGQRFSGVILATAHPLGGPAPKRLRSIVVGDQIPNFALGAFVLRREKLGSDTFDARLVTANFSPQPQGLRIKVYGDGKQLNQTEVRLEPREVGAVEFPKLPGASVYRAELGPSDDFSLDNVVYATPEAIKALEILFVTPAAADAEGLGQLAGVNVRVESPEQYAPADAASADVVVFEYTVPKELPAANALLVLPPEDPEVFRLAVKPAARASVAGWQAVDPLTQDVNFRLLDLQRAEYFGPHPWMRQVVGGEDGGLLLAGERQGHRYVAAGFNPFPYLGKKNLPMSVLTLNILSQLAGLGSESAGYRTGEPFLVPAGVAQVVTPSGESIKVKPGTLFSHDASQGIYQLVGTGGERRPRAINLADLAESDLENPAPLRLEAGAAETAMAPQFFSRQAILSFYLIAAILALAALEAMVAYRRRRRALEAAP